MCIRDSHGVPVFHSMKEDLLQGCVADTASALASNVAQLHKVSDAVKQLLADAEEGKSMPDLTGMFA